MQKLFTYLLAAGLFTLCVASYELVPANISDRLLGVVKRNVKKERQELLIDMKEVTKQGLIHFEIYNEKGRLLTTLKSPADFKAELVEEIEEINFTVRSVSNAKAFAPLQFDLIP